MKEIISTVIIIVVTLLVVLPFKVYKCHTRAVSFSEVEYKVFTGCMVKSKGRWLPLENIKGFSEE